MPDTREDTDETMNALSHQSLKKGDLRVLTGVFEQDTLDMIKGYFDAERFTLESGRCWNGAIYAVQISGRIEFIATELQPRGLTVTTNDWIKMNAAWADGGA